MQIIRRTAPLLAFVAGLIGLLALIMILPFTTQAQPAATATTALTPDSRPVRERIKTIQNYVIYYGKGRLDQLAKYHLAIIQPETLPSAELATLRAGGTLVVVYLSIGEAEPWRPWFKDGRVQESWLLGPNRNWGSYFVDVQQEGWRKLMNSLTGEYLAAGFDGVFLDTVDTVDHYPKTKPGMIALIKSLRESNPQALIVQNRGFTIAREVAPALDAIMFEGMSTTYSFARQQYLGVDNSAFARKVQALGKETGLPILSLDYVSPDKPKIAQAAVRNARRYGFIPAVSVILLDDIPDYGLER